jgi:hypothetical protein
VFLTVRIASSTTGTNYVTWGNFGDEAKWMWMARISGGAHDRFINSSFMIEPDMNWTDENAFGNYTTQEGSGQTIWKWNDQGTNSTIFKMMTYAEQQYATGQSLQVADQTGTGPSYFTKAYFAGEEITAEYASNNYNTLVPLVCIYKVNWDKYYADIASGTIIG